MVCYVVLMLKNAAMSLVLMAMPIGECQEEADRINLDYQYKPAWAYCEVKEELENGQNSRRNNKDK